MQLIWWGITIASIGIFFALVGSTINIYHEQQAARPWFNGTVTDHIVKDRYTECVFIDADGHTFITDKRPCIIPINAHIQFQMAWGNLPDVYSIKTVP